MIGLLDFTDSRGVGEEGLIWSVSESPVSELGNNSLDKPMKKKSEY